jgi:hypothetical protein
LLPSPFAFKEQKKYVMAKSQSIIKLQGTIGGLTFVNSSAYGDHVRARRGTYKPAVVNARLKQEGKMTVMANVPAKIFKDAIDPYRGQFVGGTLWSRLVSFFRKQIKTEGTFDFSKLKRFEIHERYPLDSFISAHSTVSTNKKKSKLEVEIRYNHHPQFKKVKYIDGYALTVIGIFPGLKKTPAQTSSVASKVFKMTGPISPFVAELNLPPKAKTYILCLKLEAYIKDRPSNTCTTTALCVIDSGKM